MKKINKSSIIKDKKQIPKQTGFYFLSHKEKILFIGYSTNLRNKISAFLGENPEDKNVLQLISLIDTISYETKENLFSAYIAAKFAIDKYQPEFNNILKSSANYLYFGIDFHNPPFFKIVEDTQENLYYIGAFENRFVLLDFIDTMGEIFKFPNCLDENFPCERLKEKKCESWCLKDNEQKANMVIDNYILPNYDLLDNLEDKRNDLMDDLRFLEAELLKKQMETIRKYYDRISFLFVTKELNLEFTDNKIEYKIKAGRIEEMRSENQFCGFVISDVEYRENEILAIEKGDLVESYLIYKKIKEKFPKKIEKLYDISKGKIMGRLKR